MPFLLPLLALVVFGVILGRTGVSGRLLIALGVVTAITGLFIATVWGPDPNEELSWLEGGEAGPGTEIGLWGLTLGIALVVLGFVVLLVRSGGPDGAQDRDEGVQPEQLEEGGPQEDGQVGEDDKSVPPESNT